jgi:hypothetical protein
MIVPFAELQELSGYKRQSKLILWLKRNRVTFLRDSRGRPFTTFDALNRAMCQQSRRHVD